MARMEYWAGKIRDKRTGRLYSKGFTAIMMLHHDGIARPAIISSDVPGAVVDLKFYSGFNQLAAKPNSVVRITRIKEPLC